MERPEESLSPHRPRARLKIGVTGHRPGPKLPPEAEKAVRATVEALIGSITAELGRTAKAHAWAFADEAPELVIVSALAEGADRIVAEAGLAAGAVIEAVLPSPRDDYETDFEGAAAKTAYRDLMDKARTVFALETPQGAFGRKRGYEAAGLIMLAHCDLLIAVWDEGEAAGIGGTGAIVEQAVAEGAPVLVINPKTPAEAWLLWTGDMELAPAKPRVEDLPHRPALDALPALVEVLAAPPPDAKTRRHLEDFYAEPAEPKAPPPLYSAFLALLLIRPLKGSDFKATAGPRYPAADWRKLFPGAGDPLTEAVASVLLPAITLPDRFAVRYGELYRSAFVFNFLAAAVAVAFALCGLSAELPRVHDHVDENGRLLIKVALVLCEIVILFAILAVVRRGRGRGWHGRWLNYRRAAEWLRHLRALSLVGARMPIPRPRRAVAGRGEASRGRSLDSDDWVGWYVRAVARGLPLPDRAVDAAYVAAVRHAVITAELDAQIAYHHRNAARMATASRRLHVNGLFLFGAPIALGFGFIGAYLAYCVWNKSWAFDMRFYVTALTAALPAFGAALNAIRVQGDFETVAERSEETAARLAAIRAAMLDDPPDFARLADRIQRAAAVMGAEQSEWRTLFGTRPLSLPA